MSGFRLLDFVKPFLPLLPEIELPIEKLSFDDKVLYTIGSGLIFLLAQLPIYGLPISSTIVHDPFYFMRSIFSNEKATLLELGLLPIFTAGFIWQLLAGLKLINVNFGIKLDRELFQSAQKLTSFVLGVFYAVCLVISGYFNGSAELNGVALSNWASLLIVVQISATSAFITLISEIFDKGYGFGSGALALTTLNIATNLIRDVIGIETVQSTRESESYGVIISLVKSIKSKSFGYAIVNSFTRANLPNLTQFYIAIVTVIAVIGLQNFRIELPVRSTRVRGMANVYPIKLLFVGCLPLVFTYTLLFNAHIIGFTIFKSFSNNTLVRIIVGNWEINQLNGNYELVSGLLYYLSPASTLFESIKSPIRSIVYASFIVISSTWFANLWCKISGSSPKDIAKQFKDQGISISGKRDISITKELSRVIPVAAVSGAFILSTIAILSDFLGGLGKGVGIIVAVCSAFNILEEFMIDFQSQGSANFGQIFGNPSN